MFSNVCLRYNAIDARFFSSAILSYIKMKHSHEFSNSFSGWQTGWKPIIFLNIHRPPRSVFRKYRGRVRGRESRRKYRYRIRCVQNSIYVNFAIANFHDRALTVIPSIRWQFIRDMETQESVEASATTGVR